ncbi:hypothetical protein DRP53_02975 [candidate division WOR-3 bacterium]|uniref:Permease n=1 Tax=candidate division WOR-3 bacterium TaxID=2052148 RepID=A0A660SJW8_UNCW3|nr:MAG: hypothetical protein DRP53_02975 [candidate division WOR-3 bacterium]
MKRALSKTVRQILSFLPMLFGVVFLIGLFQALLPRSVYIAVFRKQPVIDSILGSLLGSILAGNPVTSYVLGGEFLRQGVSLVAVTAFLVAWVTVGVVQLPVEAMYLGRRFALLRNLFGFLFSILVAIVTVFLLSLL